jgi:hypothetical protein
MKKCLQLEFWRNTITPKYALDILDILDTLDTLDTDTSLMICIRMIIDIFETKNQSSD